MKQTRSNKSKLVEDCKLLLFTPVLIGAGIIEMFYQGSKCVYFKLTKTPFHDTALPYASPNFEKYS